MKTINLELSKRLAPYLENIDTEYIILGGDGYEYRCEHMNSIEDGVPRGYTYYKTLNLEEAIELLPISFNHNSDTHYLRMGRNEAGFYINYVYDGGDDMNDMHLRIENPIYGNKTLLEAVEKMLEYLLDNDLLGKNL